MSSEEIIRAWKDPEGRGAGMVHPAGEIVLDADPVGGSIVSITDSTLCETQICTLFTAVC